MNRKDETMETLELMEETGDDPLMSTGDCADNLRGFQRQIEQLLRVKK